jgi:hypothetical protein
MISLRKSAGVMPSEPLTWAPDSRPSSWAVCTCPNNHLATLSKAIHSVDAHGVARPSFICPTEGCGFHDWVTLEDWSG